MPRPPFHKETEGSQPSARECDSNKEIASPLRLKEVVDSCLDSTRANLLKQLSSIFELRDESNTSIAIVNCESCVAQHKANSSATFTTRISEENQIIDVHGISEEKRPRPSPLESLASSDLCHANSNGSNNNINSTGDEIDFSETGSRSSKRRPSIAWGFKGSAGSANGLVAQAVGRSLSSGDGRSPSGRLSRISRIEGSFTSRASKAPTNLSTVMDNARRIERNRTKLEEELSQKQVTLKDMMRNNELFFDSFMALMICSNIIQIGASADLARGWLGWIMADVFFATVFTFEFFAKVWMHGWRGHLCGETWAWSVFDVFIVAIAIGELILYFSISPRGEGDGFGLSVFRIVRLCRLARILKVLRLPIFKDLLAMIDGLVFGSRTLFWSMVLLSAPIYAVAIIMRETVGEKNAESDTLHVIEPFVSFPAAFFTCFRCVMGDCSSSTGQPLPVLITDTYGWAFGAGFSVLVVATSFGLFNVIIAIYVDNIQIAAKKTEGHHLQLRLADEERYNEAMGQLVKLMVAAAGRSSLVDQIAHTIANSPCSKISDDIELEEAAKTELSREAFIAIAKSDDVQKIFDRLDIHPENRVDLFDALDADCGGSLSIAEILTGLTMLRGEQRRADIIAVNLILRTMQQKHDDAIETLMKRIKDVRSCVVSIKYDLQQSQTQRSAVHESSASKTSN